MPYIRFKDITDSDLSSHDKIELMAQAMQDLAMAQAFSIIHGIEWSKKYVAAGGRVRMIEADDGTEEPCIWTEHNTSSAVQLS